MHIDGDHPAIAGHFPDHPVVPGVLILDRVIRQAEAAGYAVSGLGSVKFLAPLLPAVEVAITFDAPLRGSLRFRVSDGDTRFAEGTLALAGPAA